MRKDPDEIPARTFNGKINGFPNRHDPDLGTRTGNRFQANLQKAHLKAYLKGKERFTYGRKIDGTPAVWQVNQTVRPF